MRRRPKTPPTMPPTSAPLGSEWLEFEPTAAPTPVAVGWLDMILVTADCDVAESVEKVTVGVVEVDEELGTAVDSGASGSTELRISRNSFAATEKRNSLAAATKRAAVSLNLSAFCGGVRREKPLSGPTPHYLPLHRDTPMLEPRFQAVSPSGICGATNVFRRKDATIQ